MRLVLLATVVLALVMAFSPRPGFAQVASGAIRGDVVDTEGQPVPGASVTVTSPALVEPRKEGADPTGQFAFELLPAGTYTVEAALAGFTPNRVENIRVLLEPIMITMKLEPVDPSAPSDPTMTEVASDPVPVIEPTGSGGRVTYEELIKVPTARDPWAVLSLIPGVQTDRRPTHVMIGAEGIVPVDLNAAIEAGFPLDLSVLNESFLVSGGGPPKTDQRILNWAAIMDENRAFERNTRGVSGPKISEEQSPMPRDRVFFNYNYFNNARSDCPNVAGRVFGFEKTFLDGAASVELRLPFTKLTPTPLDAAACEQIGEALEAGDFDAAYSTNLDFGATLGGPIVKDRLWFLGSIPVTPSDGGANTPAAPSRVANLYAGAEFTAQKRFSERWSFSANLALDDWTEHFVEGEGSFPAIRGAPMLPGLQDGGLEFPTGLRVSLGSGEGRLVRGAPSRPGRGADDTASLLDGPMIYIETLGGSTGEVVKVHVVNSDPETLTLEGFVAVEPVQIPPNQREKIVEQIRRAPGAHQEMNANFYCLEFLRQAPPEGVVYRIAGAAKQERFAPAARALDSARRLRDQGLLHPDTNPESYFHSIRQWAVWTLEQEFDRGKFLDAFLEHAKKSFTRAGREWSDPVEAAVRRSAEGRWQDVAQVLAGAP